MKTLLFLATVFATAVCCNAAIITVDWDGSGDYTTIQAAINDANGLDTIIVADGTYTGGGNRDIDFLGKAITLRSENGPETCIIDCQASFGDQLRGFKFDSSEDENSILSGFTIKNGFEIGSQGNHNYGGGIYCSDSSPTIANCIITNNTSHGGLGTPEIAFGGGIYCRAGSSPLIKDCTISNNQAIGASAIATAAPGYGGGLYSEDSSPYIVNCVFSGNSVLEDGGPDIGGEGGGIYVGYGSGSPNISNCTFIGNSADHGGGVKENITSVLSVSNCLFIGNSATRWGGGLCGYFNIKGCTFVDNSASDGGGLNCYHDTNVKNCIFWGNSDDGGTDESAQICLADVFPIPNPEVSYSCVQGLDIFSGNNNIGDNPLFVSGPQGNYYLSQTAAGQASDSPCVDAGSDTAGNLGMDKYTTRTDKVVDEGLVDMGYHYLDNIADLNDDGYVNLDDVLIMALQWLDTPGIPSADIAPDPLDNFVDYLDFTVIQQNWQWPD